ncbi:hypothetical protein D3C74_354370 [compost metagenome]
MINTIGRNIKPPRDRVSRIEITIGTSVKACIACTHHFFERVIAKIATKKNAIKKAAYVFGYWNTEARRGPFESIHTA